MWGAFILGGNCPGVNCVGSNCPGGNRLWGNCLRGNYPGGNCPAPQTQSLVVSNLHLEIKGSCFEPGC